VRSRGSSLPARSLQSPSAIAKKPGTNAVEIARAVIQRFEQLSGIFIPDGVKSAVTRNYGETADQKAKKLISKLAFATASVVLLVLLALGCRGGADRRRRGGSSRWRSPCSPPGRGGSR